jgi:glutathione S-transferase
MSPAGILYSFRRCPYAIRARLALAEAGVTVDVREVALRAKPPELIEVSAKGTVPVLHLSDGTVLEESLQILHWALDQHPRASLREAGSQLGKDPAAGLIAACDGPFKQHLDGFRYSSTEKEQHRQAATAILRDWNRTLEASGVGAPPPAPWLEPLGWALLPFLRQFRRSDPDGFAREQGFEGLKHWLEIFEGSASLARVMAAPWAPRQPWHSPRWLYHLAMESDWQEARRSGTYTRSTRGKDLQEVGFLHASLSHQVEATWRRFYGDGPELRLLVIDRARLEADGIPIRLEAAPESGEAFPHIYGALPTRAVLLAERFCPEICPETPIGRP